jgi:hypothetical protein
MGSSKHHVWFIAILKEADPIEFPIALIGAKSLALDAQIRCYSLTKFAHNIANTPIITANLRMGLTTLNCDGYLPLRHLSAYLGLFEIMSMSTKSKGFRRRSVFDS